MVGLFYEFLYLDIVFYWNDSQFLNDDGVRTSSWHTTESFIEVILNCLQQLMSVVLIFVQVSALYILYYTVFRHK